MKKKQQQRRRRRSTPTIRETSNGFVRDGKKVVVEYRRQSNEMAVSSPAI
jgi:hypothetical protein